MAFADFIKQERLNRLMTLQEFGEFLNVKSQVLCTWEHGGPPSMKFARKIAKKLEMDAVTLATLLFPDSTKQEPE